MSEHPLLALRRMPPDAVQLQVILGSLLGAGVLVGVPGARRLRLMHRADRTGYLLWKRERLGAFIDMAPRLRADGQLELLTIAHPLFDDLASLADAQLVDLLTPLGLAVWMADDGKLELRANTFLPEQRLALACA